MATAAEITQAQPALRCRFCGEVAATIQNDDRHVVRGCKSCGAANVVSKSPNTWWYHGWTRPDGSFIDADGRRGTGRRFGFWLAGGPQLSVVGEQA